MQSTDKAVPNHTEMVNRDFTSLHEMLNGASGQFNMQVAPTTVSGNLQMVHESPVKGFKRDFTEAGLDDDDESDSENGSITLDANQMQGNGTKAGKKTKGRVKIKMEFIENKLRRYTTFSKRKTGIMKKAYELSTLTGTQVMLLVASETGHVYTFATRKLQPMITSESGKALIQTCLNSPDPGGIPTGQTLDQRMNPGGFEETELSYAVSEDDQKDEIGGNPIYSMAPATPRTQLTNQNQNDVQSPTTPQTISMTTFVSPNNHATKASNISMQLPTSGLQVVPGVTLETLGMSTQQTHQAQTPTTQQQQNTQVQPFQMPGQVINFPGVNQNNHNSNSENISVPSTAHQQHQFITGTMNSNPTTQTLSSSVPQQTVMYQTPQGVVYATPSNNTTAMLPSAIPEGYLLSLPQTPTIQISQDQHNGGQQQFITIPVPVSLANSQVLQPVFTPTTPTTEES